MGLIFHKQDFDTNFQPPFYPQKGLCFENNIVMNDDMSKQAPSTATKSPRVEVKQTDAWTRKQQKKKGKGRKW